MHICFAASRFSHFISFTSNNRERTRNLSLCSSSALDLCLCSWNLWLEWCESFANFFSLSRQDMRVFSYPFFLCASAHHQSPLSRNVFKSRDALTASPPRNAVFPLCLALRRFECVFLRFVEIILIAKNVCNLYICVTCSVVVYFRADFAVSRIKGWMALAVTMYAFARQL